MAIPKPAWVDRHINVNRSPGMGKPQAVVCHIMQGTLSGCDSWFNDPRAQASANFGVGKSGEIHCYVDPDSGDWSWANGYLANPDAAVQTLVAANNNADPNTWTIAIEHEGYSGTPLTAAQLMASAQLAAYLCDRYGIPVDEDHILGHFEFDLVTRKGCPGWDRAGWVAYMSAVAAVTPSQPQPNVVEAMRQLALAQAASDNAGASIDAAVAALEGTI